jgi:hypothetical protein
MAKEWYDKNTALNVFWLISGIIWLPIYIVCEIIERIDKEGRNYTKGFEKPKWVKWWGNRVDNLPDQLIQFLHCGPCIPVINKSLNLAFMMKNRKKPYWPLFRDCGVFYPNCDEEDKN